MPVTRRKEAVSVRSSGNFFPFPGFTPFNFMRRFTDDMEKMFDDFNGFALMPRFDAELGFPRAAELEKTFWAPQIEVTENDGQLKVRADLPGLKKEDIDIELRDDSIIISGERKQESKEEREGYFRSERSYGSFYRSIPLPEGADRDKATASFENGVLDYVDLDIDILVAQNGTYSILDSDEFEENAVKHEFSDDLRADVFRAVDELTAMIERREFPFNR